MERQQELVQKYFPKQAISMIAAMAANRVIGSHGHIPWKLPEDLKRFMKITQGHPVVMGRKTLDSFQGKSLPRRTNIVISRQKNLKLLEGVSLAENLDTALAQAQCASGAEECFIIGGEEIYKQGLAHAHAIYLTLIHLKFEGDAFFPEIPSEVFEECDREDFLEHPLPYSYILYRRKS